MIITFIGHSSLCIKDEISTRLLSLLTEIIKDHSSVVFYCGGYGDFDNLCAKACHKLKIQSPTVEVIFVTPYITLSYGQRFKFIEESKIYDKIIYPPIENTPLRFAISKRNEWMIIQSDIVIAYVNKPYGGAYKALQFAHRKNKKIINLADS